MSGSTWFPASEQPAPAAPFAEAAERSVPVSETGEGQSGLRMERDAAIREREELRSEITSVRNCWGVSRFANDVLKARVAELEAAFLVNRPETPVSSSQAASGGGDHFADASKMVEQPRGWLSEDERDIIAGIAEDDEYTEEGQNIAKALLARSSPPEVVLPKLQETGIFSNEVRDAEWIAALAAAGVAVKEVGSE
jgi:hypothetical protein